MHTSGQCVSSGETAADALWSTRIGGLKNSIYCEVAFGQRTSQQPTSRTKLEGGQTIVLGYPTKNAGHTSRNTGVSIPCFPNIRIRTFMHRAVVRAKTSTEITFWCIRSSHPRRQTRPVYVETTLVSTQTDETKLERRRQTLIS